MSEFVDMEEWKEYRLGDILQISSGFAYKGKDIGYGDNFLLGMGCVSFKEKFLKSGVRNYNGDCPERYCVKPNDMVLATRQQSDNLPILGMPAIIPDDLKGGKIIVGANLYKVENKSDFDSQYIYWLLKSPSYVDYIRSCQTGTTVRMITKANIESYSFLAPNKKCRDKIVSILSSLDDKIEVNRRINEQLEELAQALFKSWFVDFEPFKDGEFVESELGMIPEGWKVTKLDEVCSYISRGLTPKYDNDSDEIILGQTCVRNNIVTLNNGRKHRPKKKNEKWIKQWDVLINSTGVGSLGRVGIVYFDKDNVAIDSHITVVRPISSLYKHYIGRTLLNKQAEIENMAIGSTGQTELQKDSVKSMLILLPIDDILVLYNKSIEPICKLMYSNLEEITHLTNLRDTLLPKLMSGEIDVNDRLIPTK